MGGKHNGKKIGSIGKSEPVRMSLSEYLVSKGVGSSAPSNPELHHNRHKSERRHEEAVEKLRRESVEWFSKKTELTAEYEAKVKSGEILKPDEIARLKQKAEAIPESESGQAAARIAARLEARKLARQVKGGA